MGGGASSSRRSDAEGSASRSSNAPPASTPHRAPIPGRPIHGQQGSTPHHHRGPVPVQGYYPTGGGPPPHGHAPPHHHGHAPPPNGSVLPPMMSYRGELAPAPQIEVREEVRAWGTHTCDAPPQLIALSLSTLPSPQPPPCAPPSPRHGNILGSHYTDFDYKVINYISS